MAQPQFVSTKELAEICGVSTVTVWKWVKKGYVPQPCKKCGKNLHHLQQTLTAAQESGLNIGVLGELALAQHQHPRQALLREVWQDVIEDFRNSKAS